MQSLALSVLCNLVFKIYGVCFISKFTIFFTYNDPEVFVRPVQGKRAALHQPCQNSKVVPVCNNYAMEVNRGCGGKTTHILNLSSRC